MAETYPLLIVDDDRDHRHYLISLFRTAAHIETLEAEDAYRALVVLKERTDVALVLLDWRMPGMDALDFIRKVNASDSAPAIVMVSAEGKSEEIAKALEAGVIDYLVKPVRNEILLHKVKILLNHEPERQQEEAARRIRVSYEATTALKVIDIHSEGCDLDSPFQVEPGSRLSITIPKLAVGLGLQPEERFNLSIESCKPLGPRFKLVGQFISLSKSLIIPLRDLLHYGQLN
ncbi:MAG: response regulator [Planctomycetota bacterium]